MKTLLIALLSLSLIGSSVTIGLTGCAAPQQRVTYNTLFSVGKATTAAFDSYLDLVIAGKIKTNGVPSVAQAYNTFQLSFNQAIVVAQFSTNAPAPVEVLAAASRVTTAIVTAKGQ